MSRRRFEGSLQRKAGVSGGGACIGRTGILASFVASRFAAGESLNALARDYDVPVRDITNAVRLVLYVNGTSLNSKRAESRVAKLVPEIL